jgi:glyoxylase-like metal-dependent hydrolase (beta-lactamase superfamily II)
MESLFGEVLPVPQDKLQVVNDGEEVEIGGLCFLPLNTPGHAEHHHAYIFEDICFSGDIGGIRVPGQRYLRLPTPPPELVIERWQDSVNKLRRAKFAKIAPTHFGIYDDPKWHLDEVEKELTATSRWLQNCVSTEPDVEQFRTDYGEWVRAEGHARGISDETMEAYDTTNPPYMSADGLRRYWMKVRQAH